MPLNIHKGTKQIFETSTQHGVSIEKSILPNASCKESAQPTLDQIQVYGRRNKDGTHSESTYIEAPSSIQHLNPYLK